MRKRRRTFRSDELNITLGLNLIASALIAGADLQFGNEEGDNGMFPVLCVLWIVDPYGVNIM